MIYDLNSHAQIDKITQPIIAIITPAETKPPEPIKYQVVEGDYLEAIATSHGVPLQRLWAANPQLSSPDILKPSDTLTIPLNTDVLADRPFPATVVADVNQNSKAAVGTKVTEGGFSVSGNTYSPGYCTFYVKNMRPDLPNNLGNADTWYVRYGGAKGSAPVVGAVAVARGYMHVALVIAVHGDTVVLSEMNYQGWNVVSSRTAPASEFNYIY